MLRRALILLAACASEDPDDTLDVCGDGMRSAFEACDDGNLVAGDGCDRLCQAEPAVSVQWRFYPVLDGPARTRCRDDVTEVELVTEVDTTARFACDAGSGTIFVPVTKRAFARFRGAGDAILGETLPFSVTSSTLIEASFYEDAGYLRASLPLAGDCGSPITLTITDEAAQTRTQILGCANDRPPIVLTSRPIRAGTVTVVFTTAAGETFGRSGVVIGANNRITELAF